MISRDSRDMRQLFLTTDSSVPETYDCIGDFDMELSHGSLAPLTPVAGAVDTKLVLVQKLVTHKVPRRSFRILRVARLLAPRPDAKRPSGGSPCQ